MGLDPDGHGDAVAGVDHPGVLARTDEHVRGLGGQSPQVDPRRLVRAVLAPHDGEQGQLEVVGDPAEDAHDLVALAVGQPERPVKRLARFGQQVGLLVSARVHGRSVPGRLPARRCPRRYRSGSGTAIAGNGASGSRCIGTFTATHSGARRGTGAGPLGAEFPP